MLTNQPIIPVPDDLDRRWIADEYFDLIVWYEPTGETHGFQLCYDKPNRERALTWTRDGGFLHTAIDSGDSAPTTNRTPILVTDAVFPAGQVRTEFLMRGRLLLAEIREMVLSRIKDYESSQGA